MDDRYEYDEVRVYAIGIVNGVEITVIYTDVAEPDEREAYWRNIVLKSVPTGSAFGPGVTVKSGTGSRWIPTRDRHGVLEEGACCHPGNKTNHYDTIRCGPAGVAAPAERLSDENQRGSADVYGSEPCICQAETKCPAPLTRR